MARVNLPITYSQFDPLWSNILLGHNTDPKFTIYNYGCLVTSLANVSRYYGKEENPATLNEKLKEGGIDGFAPNGGLYQWGSLNKIYPDITEKHVVTPEPLTDEQIAEIKEALDQHKPVLICLDYNPKTVASENHFSLVVDYDPADENNFTLADTLGGLLRSLRTYLAWFKPSARVTIESYTIYSGPAESRPVENLPIQVNQIIDTPLPPNYADIVHGSTEWDQVVTKYGNGKAPAQTNFGEVEQEITKQVAGKVNEQVAAQPAAEKIVVSDSHAAEQWAQIVEYLELGKQPNDALFEDAKRVIAGLKSAKTDYDNKRIDAEKIAAQKEVLITNKDAEIGNLRKQVLRMEKIQKAEIAALIANTPTFNKLKVQFEGALKELQDDVEKATSEAGALRISLSDKEVEQGAGPAITITTRSSILDQLDPLVAVAKTVFAAGNSASGIIVAIVKKYFPKK